MLAVLDTDDLKAVRDLERLRIEAARQNDADLLAPLLDEQFIFINSAGAVFGKDHYLRGIRTRSFGHDRHFDVLETKADVLDDVIILVGILLGRPGLDGEPPTFHFPCIGVWRRDSGRWRMLAWQSPSGSMASQTRATAPATARAPRAPILHRMRVSGRAPWRAAICSGG